MKLRIHCNIAYYMIFLSLVMLLFSFIRGIVVTKYALNFQKIKIDVLKSSLLLGIFRYKE